MSNLIQVTPVQSTISDNLVYICNETKQPYVNLAQLCIMFPNVSEPTIRRRLKEVSLSEVKNARLFANTREYEVSLYSSKVVVSLAKEFDSTLLDKLIDAGATLFLYNLAGYKLEVVEPKQKTQLQLPQSYAEALRQLASEVEEKEKAQALLVEAQPKIDFCDRVEASPELCTMGDFLKAQGWGRTLGFKELRDLGVIQKQSNLPYQHYIKAGYFTVHTNILGIQSARITGRGQVWLSQQLSIQPKPDVTPKKRTRDASDYLAAKSELETKGLKVTQQDLAKALDCTEQTVRDNTKRLFGAWDNFLNGDDED